DRQGEDAPLRVEDLALLVEEDVAKRQAAGEEQPADVDGEGGGDDADEELAARAERAGEHVDVEEAIRLRGERGADEADEEDRVADDLVGPERRRRREVPLQRAVDADDDEGEEADGDGHALDVHEAPVDGPERRDEARLDGNGLVFAEMSRALGFGKVGHEPIIQSSREVNDPDNSRAAVRGTGERPEQPSGEPRQRQRQRQQRLWKNREPEEPGLTLSSLADAVADADDADAKRWRGLTLGARLGD